MAQLLRTDSIIALCVIAALIVFVLLLSLTVFLYKRTRFKARKKAREANGVLEPCDGVRGIKWRRNSGTVNTSFENIEDISAEGRPTASNSNHKVVET